MIETLFGVGSGLLIRFWANALGKQRPLWRPWNHVLFGAVGGYVGYHYGGWQDDLLASVNEKRALRNMPQITRQSLNPVFKHIGGSSEEKA